MSMHATYLYSSFPSNADALPLQPAVSSPPELDFDGFSSGSELEFENTFGLSPGSSAAPSTNIVSPKSALNEFGLVDPDNELNKQSPSNLNTAEALSAHHLQRFLHYQALAEQAEQQARLMGQQLELFNFGMSMDHTVNNAVPAYGYTNQVDMNKGVSNQNMLAFQPQPQPIAIQQPVYAPVNMWQSGPVMPAQPVSYHAQAQAHMQAHQAAQGSVNMAGPFYMPTQADNAAWSQQSASSIASASVPTTPAAPMAVPMSTSIPAPSTIAMSRIASSEGEVELDRMSTVSDDDVKPQLPTDIPLTNLNGGGRGYVPGQTPDDPKKRHRCGVCGRSFARAFNLKVGHLVVVVET
jgi:hypothetical protein